MIEIKTPFTVQQADQLHAGDSVLFTGTLYTARDAAHARLCQALEEGRPLPFDLTDAVIYYVGPTPPRPGRVIGSAGPTTSYRMDAYSPALLDQGLRGMIGKGLRGREVIEAMRRNHAVYFGAVGGTGALIGRAIRTAEVIAYEDLGTEAIRRLTVEKLPLTVVIDTQGNNLYETGPRQYLEFAGQHFNQ